MTYYPGAQGFPSNAMPGEPTTGHSVSTGVKKARVPKVKGKVSYGVKRPPKTKKARAPRTNGGAPAPQTGLSPSDKKLIEAATRLRFGGQEQQLNQQLGQNQRFTSGLPAWYANALGEIRGLQSAGQQASQQTLGAIQDYNSTPTLNNPTDQQAALARNTLNSQYGAMVGRDANANSAAMDRLAAAFLIQQGNTTNAANAERMGLLGQQGQLAGQKGDFATTYGAQLQSAGQKALMDQAKLDIARNAGLLKEDQYKNVQLPLAKSLTQSRRSGARDKKKRTELTASDPSRVKTQQEIDFFNKHGYYPGTGKKGGKGGAGDGFSRTEGSKNAHHKIIRTVDNAIDDVSRGRKQGLKDDAIRGAMKLEKIPNDVIDAAFTLAAGGYLSASQIKRLKNAGLIAAPKKWKMPKPKIVAGRPEVSVGPPK